MYLQDLQYFYNILYDKSRLDNKYKTVKSMLISVTPILKQENQRIQNNKGEKESPFFIKKKTT